MTPNPVSMHTTARHRLSILLLAAALVAQLVVVTPNEASAQSPFVSVNLTVAPETLIADATRRQAVYIQLTDSEGVPILAAEDMEITLASSNPFVVATQPSVSIGKGEGLGVGTIDTTLTPGAFTIIASLDGEAIATATGLTIQSEVGDLPLQIRAEAAPELLIAHGEPHGLLSIALTNAQGLLSSPRKDLTVTIQSSDPDAVRIQGVVTVPAGSPFVTVDVVPLDVGSATISVVAPGYLPAFVEIHTVPVGGVPESLNVFVAPSLVRRIGTEPQQLVVQALDRTGLPTYFPCVNVHVSSSNPDAAEVVAPERINCAEQRQVVTGSLWAGDDTGVAVVSATAEGLDPDTFEVIAQGRQVAALLATVLPAQPISSSATAGYILVETLDANGVPTREHGPIDFTVVGASDFAPTQGKVAAGESYAVLPLRGGSASRSQTVWIVTSDLSPAEVQVDFLSPLLGLDISRDPAMAYPGDAVRLDARVLSAGFPAGDVSLQWTILGDGSFLERSDESDLDGKATAVFLASTPGDARIELRASRPGFGTQVTEIIVPVASPSEMEPGSAATIFGIKVQHLLTLTALAIVAQLGWTSRLFVRSRRSPASER